MIRIVEDSVVINPSDGTGKYVIEGDNIPELRSRDAANLVINHAAVNGLTRAGISQHGPSAYPVGPDGNPIQELKGGAPSKFRMDIELRQPR